MYYRIGGAGAAGVRPVCSYESASCAEGFKGSREYQGNWVDRDTEIRNSCSKSVSRLHITSSRRLTTSDQRNHPSTVSSELSICRELSG